VIHFFQGLSYNKDVIEIPVLTSDTWESPYKSFFAVVLKVVIFHTKSLNLIMFRNNTLSYNKI